MPTECATVSLVMNAWKVFWWVIKFSIAALVIALPIRWFVAQPLLVSGASMEPTFMPNEYIVIDKLWFKFHKPERGDVIIMRYPLDPSKFFVKRVVGLPGETVSISDGKVSILSKDHIIISLDEPYIEFDRGDDTATTTLSDNEYFVLGDNREQSSDSREWGPLQEKFILGRVYARLFPARTLSLFPGEYRFPLK